MKPPLHLLAVGASVLIHALALSWLLTFAAGPVKTSNKEDDSLVLIQTLQPLTSAPQAAFNKAKTQALAQPALAQTPAPEVAAEGKTLTTQAAPPAPSAEQWAFATKYTLKNSKAYRHTLGQQVRSMMGTATEGPDQGHVRFRFEIAPNGTLLQLVTLWQTSQVAEARARQAIARMGQWPPTPTGKPLVFEKTIAFTPFASDDTPSYQDDCQPDPPAFRNPFAWDGQSEPRMPNAAPREAANAQAQAQALQDCLAQLPKDSIEAELARDRRAMERWGWK
jgi:hypothetical protein